ncbi:MAG TPA: hypothetical protein VL985_13215 [Stellaceae bacterium]|nr:hypothetical protein [Stellaceae bacterium]
MATTQCILRYARWLEKVSPGFVATAIMMQTGQNYAGRDLLDQAARLIEIFGVIGAAEIVGCPRQDCRAAGCDRQTP